MASAVGAGPVASKVTATDPDNRSAGKAFEHPARLTATASSRAIVILAIWNRPPLG